MHQGVTGFSNSQRLHYQKPRSDLKGFKWRHDAEEGEDEMPPLVTPSATPTPARSETRPTLPQLALGSQVSIKGLNSQKHLNGCSGTIKQDRSRH
eukprot:g32733.t1